jgi:hypothetical protein
MTPREPGNRLTVVTWCVAAFCALCGRANAADKTPDTEAARPSAEAAEFFNRKIRPLLTARCLECHGGAKQKGGLRLDSPAAFAAGGDSGVAVVPGKPDESLLIEAIRYASDLKMPPKSKLPAEEIALFVRWVEAGAIWPKGDSPVPERPMEKTAASVTDEDRAFWAFQPIAAPAIPPVRNTTWPKSPLDHFVLARLEASGLSPAPPADRRTLIRRATLDLTGLPPTPAEVDAFLTDGSEDAFARVVDRLLASPHYGERWGRHWLDIARYADSNGLDENLAYANAFRYRDYVVAAFNNDKPFDRFLHEQLAGDLLPPTEDLAELSERITATGFLSLGGKMLAEDDPVKMQMDIIDEQVDTIGRALLGLTVGCARCHDHKFDPLPQEDYYSLAGIFKSTRTMENFTVVARWQERPLALPAAVKERDARQKQIDAEKAEIARIVERSNADLVRTARRQTGRLLLAAAARGELDELVRSRPARGGDPKLQDEAGVVQIEAEDYLRGNVLKDRENYGKGIGVLVNRGEQPNFAEYEFHVETAGLFQFELRYAAAEARPTRLYVNGQLVKNDAAGRTTGSWYPDSQTWFLEGFFRLKAGTNVVRLENAKVFPHIDRLLLFPARDVAEALPAEAFLSEEGSAESAAKAAFIGQWAHYLARTKNDADSVFAVWHEFVAASPRFRLAGANGTGANAAAPPEAPRESGGEPSAIAHAIRERLLADPRPETLEQLAARYEELFREAEPAEVPANEPKKTAEAEPAPDVVRNAIRTVIQDKHGPIAIPSQSEALYPAAVIADLKGRRDQLKSHEEALPRFPEAMAVSEGKPENLRVHLRGSHLTLGPETPRRFPRVLAGDNQPALDAAQSGRLQFARWLTAPENPLTSRVIANRLWLWHFGEGIVRSPDNFGRLGERPAQPKLLDYLAGELVRRGWSLKSLHRLILLSATYAMSTTYDERAAAIDPENRLLWRMHRRRLEAEAIRDSILAVAGTLDPTMGGSLLPTANRAYVTSTASVNPRVYESLRRSIYLPVVRSALYNVFQAFDFADPSTLSGRRDTTTVAPQALFMLNSAFILEQTKVLARGLLADDRLDDAGRIGQLYVSALSRPPTDEETARGLAFIERYRQALAGESLPPDEQRLRAWQTFCRAILASNEFVYLE